MFSNLCKEISVGACALEARFDICFQIYGRKYQLAHALKRQVLTCFQIYARKYQLAHASLCPPRYERFPIESFVLKIEQIGQLKFRLSQLEDVRNFNAQHLLIFNC